jgi:hypothetical protein
VGPDLIHFIPRKQEDNGRNDKKTKINKTRAKIKQEGNSSIDEGRKFVLFCNYEIHRTGMLQIMSLESSQ